MNGKKFPLQLLSPSFLQLQPPVLASCLEKEVKTSSVSVMTPPTAGFLSGGLIF